MTGRIYAGLAMIVLVALMFVQVGCDCGCGKRHLGGHETAAADVDAAADTASTTEASAPSVSASPASEAGSDDARADARADDVR